MFTPIATARLLLRHYRGSDAAGLFARRNDPAVAEYQTWTLPYPRESAEELVAALVAMDGPSDDEWWMLAIADRDDTVVYGDLALRMAWEGRAFEIGYTLDRAHWGNGYATEAVTAIVDHLFGDGRVTRVQGLLHPDNRRSAAVLERTGFITEGRTRLSYWVGDENSDDLIYGMTADDWATWTHRPRTPPEDVRLVPVDQSNEQAVVALKTHTSQESFVAPMVWSYADALFPEIVDGAPLVPWMRGVEADGTMVAFVMLALVTDVHPEPYLWRLLVDRLHQRRGIGRRVLDLVVGECRTMGYRSLLTSWVEGQGSPRPFYERYGFETTGRIIDDETEARLVL